MSKGNFPNTSFMNLFKNIIYDKDSNPNITLDIWDAYVISPFYKQELRYFQMHKVAANDTWVSLARFYYQDERLWWIIPMFNDVEDPFLVNSPDLFRASIKQVKVLQPQHMNTLLLAARQQKIQNDRAFEKENNQ